jgi:hypothetical protein
MEIMDFKKRAADFWNANPAGWVWGTGTEPETKEYFERVLEKRSSYEIPWLFDVVPFASFKNKGVLEVGWEPGSRPRLDHRIVIKLIMI